MSILKGLLGIELPVIQAPMAGHQGSALAVAVSEAGGLGSLPAATLSLETLRAELSALREQTRRPFNVNFFCHAEPVPDAAREAAWRDRLRPCYSQLGIAPDAIVAGAARRPFNDAIAELVAAFAPPVVSFHFGLPVPELLQRVKAWGAKVLSSATTVAEARWLEENGADVIIAQGLEAGGHRGLFLTEDLDSQLGTFALVPQIVRAVDHPVIAAGGIVDAATARAAMALGASGVQAGTAYLLCPEATTGEVHRRMLASDAASQTALTNLFSGRPARGIVNRFMREQGPVDPVAPPFPLAVAAVAPLRARSESEGSPDFAQMWCGQNASACRPLPAAEITRELARGCIC